jgi:bacterioferritin-associated ferredoxin
MYVCLCNKVTDGQIREATQRGADTFDKLQQELKVATCCGRCRDCACQVMADAQAERWALEPDLAFA